MLNKLMYVTIYVSDQDRALEFYTETLGLEKRVDYTLRDGRFLTVAPAGEAVEIVLWPGEPGQGSAVDATDEDIVPGPIFLMSDDLNKEFEQLKARGAKLGEDAPTEHAWGTRLTVFDPDGNRIELRGPRTGSDRRRKK